MHEIFFLISIFLFIIFQDIIKFIFNKMPQKTPNFNYIYEIDLFSTSQSFLFTVPRPSKKKYVLEMVVTFSVVFYL